MKNEIIAYPIPTICDYCGSPVIFTSNAAIYGKEYGNGKCYKCTSCDSYFGVHDGTIVLLGRLANKELRTLKKRCHALFDPVWKGNNNISRGQAYGKLTNILGISVAECHFGWFNEDVLIHCINIMSNDNWCKGSKNAG